MNASAAVRRQRFAYRWSPLLAGLFALAMAGGLLAWKLSAPRAVVPTGTFVRYDDFAFAVVDARRAAGPDADTDRFVLTIECQNRAKRVPFTFKSDMVDVRSGSKGLAVSPESWKGNIELKAGENARQTVVVTGPHALREVSVWFRTGGDFGDFMDAVLDKNYEVRVPVK